MAPETVQSGTGNKVASRRKNYCIWNELYVDIKRAYN